MKSKGSLLLVLFTVLLICPIQAFGQVFDYGDAPDLPYQTLSINNGAVHAIDPPFYLGTLIDPEPDGISSATALGDDNNPAQADDEDGVIITTPVIPGNSMTIKVIASMPGFLDAWIDWNNDGDWADANENIFAAEPLSPGTNFLSEYVPNNAAPGVTFSRWRYSSIGGLSYNGFAPDGEVEDYRIFIMEPIENDKWYQPPNLDNTGMDVDMFPFPVYEYNGLADDFLCNFTGPITDIHFWGSFRNDVIPDLPSQTFEISFYADIPAGQVDYSMPGELLWRYVFEPGTYIVTQITDNNPEDYYVIPGAVWIDDNHLNCYQYDIYIPGEIAFFQEEGIIYWLGIRDINAQPEYGFGWKTTPDYFNWNDNATYLCDPPGFWCPLYYPVGHEYTPETSVNLAFALTTPCNCMPGNCNGDGTINIFDITYLINFLYKGGLPPIPYALCSGDPNCDCLVNIFDVTYLITYLYKAGPAPCNCTDWLNACGPPLR